MKTIIYQGREIEVTVPLTLPLALYRQVLAMAAYDTMRLHQDAGFSAAVVRGMEGEVEAWLEAGDKNPTPPARYLKKYERELAAGQHPQVYPPPAALTLDPVASAMLRKVSQEGDACRHPGEDPRDLVNAAVTFYLSDDQNDRHGEFDLSCGDEALARAKHDRLATESEVAA